MYCNFFIHSSVNGYLGCFHVLAIVNSSAMNNGIHVSFSILVSSGYMPRMGLLGHMVALFLVFWEFAVWLRKFKQGLCINLEGWGGEGDGREVQKGGYICTPMAADSC